MKLSPNEHLILSAWAKGLMGASQRLARRAWWVLQDRLKERTQVTGGGAWANAMEAQRWVLNFHAMGLVGLMDAPRAGRPMIHAEAVEEIEGRMRQIQQSQVADVDAVKLAQFDDLTKQEKEAVWRQSRLKGQEVVRRRNGASLPLDVPYELRDVLGIVLTRGIKILAFFEHSENYWNELNGSWIGVPKVKKTSLSSSVLNRKSLLSALALDVQIAKTNVRPDGPTNWMIASAIEHISTIAAEHPGKVSLMIAFDINTPKVLLKLLQSMRSKRMWAHKNPKIQGVLNELHVYPYENNWGFAVQQALGLHLSRASSTVLGEFQDVLTLKRNAPFCWLRKPDTTME
jgi:hypothetical protein